MLSTIFISLAQVEEHEPEAAAEAK
jgi:hypothetical protein